MGVTPVGEIRVWGYKTGHKFKVIKRENGFVHYAQWLWEQHYGKAPNGYVVRTKDGSLNVIIDNLEMITRAEHAIRNSVIRSSLPPELQKTKRLINLINKKIKNHA